MLDTSDALLSRGGAQCEISISRELLLRLTCAGLRGFDHRARTAQRRACLRRGDRDDPRGLPQIKSRDLTTARVTHEPVFR